MTLTLTCHCGTHGEWIADTFTEIRNLVTGVGWDITQPLCPEHAQEETQS